MIDVILTTWNLRSISLEAINTFLETVEIPHRLIVVDNGSNDGLEEDLEKLSKSGIIYLIKTVNTSLAHAINLGLAKVETPYVAYITNDIIFKQKGWLKKLIETMDSDPKIAFVGCKMKFLNERIMHGGASYWNWDGSGKNKWRHFGYDQPDNGEYDNIREVPGCCMAVCLWRTDIVRSIGLNEEYVGSGVCADCELCVELRKAGYRIYYNGTAVVYHRNRQSDILKPREILLNQEKENISRFYEKYQSFIDEDKKSHPEVYS